MLFAHNINFLCEFLFFNDDALAADLIHDGVYFSTVRNNNLSLIEKEFYDLFTHLPNYLVFMINHKTSKVSIYMLLT